MTTHAERHRERIAGMRRASGQGGAANGHRGSEQPARAPDRAAGCVKALQAVRRLEDAEVVRKARGRWTRLKEAWRGR
jgi:hypothetical protein